MSKSKWLACVCGAWVHVEDVAIHYRTKHEQKGKRTAPTPEEQSEAQSAD